MNFQYILFLFFIIVFATISRSQTNCGPRDYKPGTDTASGHDRLWAYGADTLVTISKQQIIYYCESCTLTGSDKKGVRKWIIDLGPYKCSLITFTFFNCKTGDEIKGGDIVLQFKTKTFYSLNSKTGKITLLSEADIEQNRSLGLMGIKMILLRHGGKLSNQKN